MHRIVNVPSYWDHIPTLATEHDLILLDLDDVVLTPAQYVCGSLWMARYFQQLKGRLNPTQLIDTFYHCQNTTDVVAVSHELNRRFSLLAQNDTVLGLTARFHGFREKTLAQLQGVGMTFSTVTSEIHQIADGVIYAGFDPGTMKPNNKGHVLRKILDDRVLDSGRNVESVFFMDDSLHNLEVVAAEMLQMRKAFTGVHLSEVRTRLLCERTEQELEQLFAPHLLGEQLEVFLLQKTSRWQNHSTLSLFFS
eukprot:g44081.t1